MLSRSMGVSLAVALSLSLPFLAAAATTAPITVSDAWTRATPAGAPVGAGYMTVTNNGTKAVKLTGGESPVAEKVEVHSMTMEGGVMRMRPVSAGLEIPAGQAVALKPGGNHLMLIGLKSALTEGSSVPVTLHFEGAPAVHVDLAVRAANGGGHGH